MAPPSKTLSMNINDYTVNVTKIDGEDYICLTDMAKSYGATLVIENWLRNKNTLEFLGVWEELNNPDFNSHDFEVIKNTHLISENKSQSERIDILAKETKRQYETLIAIKEIEDAKAIGK